MYIEKHKGISGWLFLLCLNLTVIIPLINIMGFASSYRTASAKSYFEILGFLNFFIINFILLAIVVSFSVYAGIMLIKVRPNSVRIVKMFLVFESGCAILFNVFPYLAGLPQELASPMMVSLLKNTARIITWNIVWYFYLNKSKRVMATYVNNISN